MKLVYAAPWIVMACCLMGRVARCDEREQREAYLRMAESELPADSSWCLQDWRAIFYSLVDERAQALRSLRQVRSDTQRRITAVAVGTMEISRGNLAAATQAIDAAYRSPKIDGTRAHYRALLLADAYQAAQQDAQALEVLRRAGETPSADLLAMAGDIKGALRSLRARKIDDRYEYVLHDTARIAVQLIHSGRVGDAAQMIADLEPADRNKCRAITAVGVAYDLDFSTAESMARGIDDPRRRDIVLRWLDKFAAEHARSAAAFSRTDARRELARVEEGWSRYWALIRVGKIEAERGHEELARVHLEEAYRILAADTFVPCGWTEVARVIVRKNRLVEAQSMAGDLAGAITTAELDVVRNGRTDHVDCEAFGHAILCSRQIDVATLERHIREQTSALVRAHGYFALAGRGVPHVTGMAPSSLPDYTDLTDLRVRWSRLNSRWHTRDLEELPEGVRADLRENLARNLGWYSVDPGAVRLLTTLTLSDKDSRVRAAAARALGVTQLDIREAADLLRPGLQDSDGMVRLEVAKVLLRAGEPIKSIRDAVVALLSDGDDDLVALAAEVAGELHDASEPLVAALKEAAKRPDAYPRLFAARSMLTLDATRDDALDVLTKLLSCDNLWVAAKSAEALGALGIRGERAWGQLVSCLGQPDQYLQLHAAVAMMAIGGENAESTIALEWIYLNGSTPELRHWAAMCVPWAIDQPAWEPIPLEYCV